MSSRPPSDATGANDLQNQYPLPEAIEHPLLQIVAYDKNFSCIWAYTSMMLSRVRNHHGEYVYFDTLMLSGQLPGGNENVIPRGVAWSNGLKFEKSSYERFFYSKNSTVNKLIPSAIEMNELWWRSSLDYFKKVNRSIPVLRSATKGSSKGKSVHTRVRTEVRHEVHVRNEVSRVHSHVPAVEKNDIQERDELLKTVKEQKQIILDLQLRLNSVEEKLKPGPSDVDHLDKNWNDVSDNFHADGLDHKSVEGVSQCTGLNDEYKSVAVDGLISIRSQDFIDFPQVKVNDNEEACHSDYCLSTQQVQDDVNVDSLVKEEIVKDHDACVSELLDVVKDDVNVNSVVKEEIMKDDVNDMTFQDVTRSPIAPKRTVTVPEEVNALFRDKNRMEMKWTFPWEPNVDWAMASPYLCDMLSRFQYPFYYTDGVKYGVPWFANNVQKVYFPINEKDSHWVLGELHISSGLITIYNSLGCPPNGIKPAYGIPIQGGLYGDCGLWVCIFLYRLSHNIPLEVDDPINIALAYRE
ncbi:ulp1 protease family, C-terminal catalytic domain-containing protein [Tanacetum coccineum]